jgi:hypothetical protein
MSIQLNLLLVTYDLNNPEQTYPGLFTVLQVSGARQILSSVWIVITPSSAADLRDALQDLLYPNDRLLVVNVNDCAPWNSMCDINEIWPLHG